MHNSSDTKYYLHMDGMRKIWRKRIRCSNNVINIITAIHLWFYICIN